MLPCLRHRRRSQTSPVAVPEICSPYFRRLQISTAATPFCSLVSAKRGNQCAQSVLFRISPLRAAVRKGLVCVFACGKNYSCVGRNADAQQSTGLLHLDLRVPSISAYQKSTCFGRCFLVRRKGLEPPTYWFVASHSIQLSYRRMIHASTRSNIITYSFGKSKYFFQNF